MTKYTFPKGNKIWKLRDHDKTVDKIKATTQTEEFKQSQSEKAKSAWSDPETRAKYIKGFKKRKNPTKESNKKRSDTLKKIFAKQGGNNLGCKFSNEVNKRKGRSGDLNAMSKFEHRIKLMGKNHYNWRGGIANEPYAPGFCKELKIIIKKIDNNKCVLCPNKEVLHIHHIDYNKQNHNMDNLVTLCHKCHPKTNTRRKIWEKELKEFVTNGRNQQIVMEQRQPFYQILSVCKNC